jgi:hypothetical protein
MRSLITYLFIILLFSNCRKENAFDCFTSSGREITQERRPGIFSDLVVYNKFDVTIVQGSEYRVEVTAGQNLLKNIITRIDGGTLYIENLNTCNFVRGYKKTLKVKVTAPALSLINNTSVGTMRIAEGFSQKELRIRAESSGDIHVNGNIETLRTSTHGNGDLYLTGSCNALYVYTFGTNFVHAENLNIRDYAFVDTYSIGDCHVNVTNVPLFDYNIWRDGNIYYSGEPKSVRGFTWPEAKGQAFKN